MPPLDAARASLDSEVADRDARAADRAQLAALEAQISHPEQALAELLPMRESVQARLDAVKYPVLTLPPEIITEIFTQFLPVYPLCSPLLGRSSPTVLTHICHLWREIAQGTPALWRAIDLVEEEFPADAEADILDAWFDRSRSYPLSIRIGEHSIESIVPHRARWEHLYIEAGVTELPELSSGPLPLLRSLQAKLYDYNDDTVVSWLDAPLLRSVTLHDVATERFILPWAQLTSLTLHMVPVSRCVRILDQTPHLVYCSLSLVSEWAGPTAVPRQQMSLPHLESMTMLDVQTYLAMTLARYFKTFVVPALSMLQVPESFLGEDPIRFLASFIQNSGCELRDVVITGDEIAFRDSYPSEFPSINFAFGPRSTSPA
ncbi:hypothetical protein C8R46DRAFT_1057639 [Mycena filopes]|nr:hypothetical protein C8R46DRAFT_1057639 [Mycena filopes]